MSQSTSPARSRHNVPLANGCQKNAGINTEGNLKTRRYLTYATHTEKYHAVLTAGIAVTAQGPCLEGARVAIATRVRRRGSVAVVAAAVALLIALQPAVAAHGVAPLHSGYVVAAGHRVGPDVRLDVDQRAGREAGGHWGGAHLPREGPRVDAICYCQCAG